MKRGTPAPPISKRPIRMRGYYRAVKHGEKWATDIEYYRDRSPVQYCLGLLYRNVDFSEMIYAGSPFLALIPKEGGFGGKYTPVPLYPNG